ncbi:GNAT family N-acetyltransferase [Stakelama saccharophila]|uniref:GNAT family N-acetyltransferase n=1 Tax=Stakelama saccharophila TaxID=3075605 RepID=A0ABZ0BBS7_9SPHN|nr:GNAT family N-acetyltransferase [Stakelama sp. W311]WNO54739.1 GNAT family N-acetyltransferase [Stakelama sp. W311]
MTAFRDARPADGPELAAMAARSFTETFGTLYPPADLRAFLDRTFGEAGLIAHLGDPAYRVRIAIRDDRIVGFAKIGPVDFPGDWGDATVELCQLYVLGECHGAGIGPALMDWALATARNEGYGRMVLSVYVDNHHARRFYERRGFVEVGRYDFVVGETIDDDRIMALSL